jgi:hypothetical protein
VAPRLPEVRQEFHLGLLQRADKQRRSGHFLINLCGPIIADIHTSPEVLIPVNFYRTQH